MPRSHIRNIVASLVTLALVLTSLVAASLITTSSAHASDDPTQRIDLTLSTVEHLQQGTPERWEYWSGEQINPFAAFQVSGTNVNIPNGVVTLKVKKNRFITKKPTFVESQAAARTEYREDADYWYADYFYTLIQGGSELGVPFPFTFANKITPNGETTEVSLTIYDANKRVIKDIKRTFTAKSQLSYRVEKETKWCQGHSSYERFSIDGMNTLTCVYQKENPDSYTKVETLAGNTKTQVSYELRTVYVPTAGANASQGEYVPQSVRYVDTLPEGAVLAETSITEGWTYVDASRREVTKTVPVTSTNDSRVAVTRIFVDFVDANINKNGTAVRDTKRHDNQVRAFLNPDSGNVDIGTSTAAVGFRVVPVPPKPVFGGRTHAFTYDKGYQGATDVKYSNGAFWSGDRGPQTEHTQTPKFRIGYNLAVSQTNNGSDLTDIKTGGITDSVTEIVDDRLDEALYYAETAIRFDRNSGASLSDDEVRQRINNSRPEIYGVAADGSETKLFDVSIDSGKSISSLYFVNDTARQYEKLKLKFTTPLEMDNFRLGFFVDVFPTKAELQKWMNDGYSNVNDRRTYENWMTTKAYNTETNESVVHRNESNQNNNTFTISTLIHVLRGSASSTNTVPFKKCSTDPEQLVPENTQTRTGCSGVKLYSVQGFPEGSWAGYNEPLKNYRQIILLPQGVDYVRTVRTSANTHVGWDAQPREPKKVANFNNTGKTALIYEYGDVVPTEAGRLNVQSDFHLYTTMYAEQGANPIETYNLWDNPTVRPYGTATDYADVNQNGDTTDKVVRYTVTTNLLPPAELSSRKLVSYDENAWFLNAPPQDLSGPVYYKLDLNNARISAISSLSVIDVFPQLADKKISPNEAGAYQPRTWDKYTEAGETQKVTHSGYETPPVKGIYKVISKVKTGAPVDATDRFAYFYSKVAQTPDTTIETIRDGAWLTAAEVDDWSQIKNFKAVLKTGEKLLPGEVVSFITKHEIPFNDTTKALEVGTRAVNSFAYSTNNYNYLEANEVTSEIIKYEVNGIMFSDIDFNGVKRADEKTLSGYQVTLLNADTGAVATHPDGTPITGETDENGFYSLTVYTRGNYTVRFSTKESEQFSVPGNGDVKVSNHVRSCSQTAGTNPADFGGHDCWVRQNDSAIHGITDVFKLDPTKRVQTRNAATSTLLRDFVVKKVDQDGNPLSGITFKLTWRGGDPTYGEPLNPPAPIEKNTGADGEVIFENLPFGIYELEEKNVPAGIEGLEAPQRIALSTNPYATDDEGNALREYKVVNNVIRGTVRVQKVDAEQATKSLSGAVFALQSTTDPNVRLVSDPTGKDGVAQFTDVLYGTYTLSEVTAPENYVRSTATKTVTVDKHGQTYDLGQFANTIFKGEVRLKKVDADTNNPISGVTFELYKAVDGQKQGDPVATETTDNQGMLTIPNISFGKYLLVEKTPAQGYLPLTEELAVDITANEQVVDYVTNPVTNRIKKSNITLVKVDADDVTKTLPGVTFKLYPKTGDTVAATEVATAVTNDQGVATFNNVRYGSYVVRETETLEGYRLDTTDKPVTVTEDGETLTLGNIPNQFITGSVTLRKVDDDTPAKPLQGAVFGLYLKDTGGNVADAPTYQATTTETGVAEFTGVKYGKYELREISTIAGHNLNTVDKREIVIDQPAEENDLTANPFVNTRIRGNVEVIKHDFNNQPLSAVHFALYKKDANGVNTSAAYTAITNGEGVATFANVLYGTYVLKETQPKTGYNPSAETDGREVTVTEQGVTVSAGDPFRNKIITGTVKVTKVDADTPTLLLAGVKFGLFSKQPDGTYANAPSYEVLTDVHGVATFNDVEYGEYQLREVTPLINYVPTTATQTVVIRTEAQEVQLDTVHNTLKKGSVVLRKVDADNPNQPVANTTFVLKQADEVKYRATSDAQGNVTFTNVVYGVYEATEERAPENYNLNTQWNAQVNINQDKQVVNLGTVTNALKKAPVRVVKYSTDDQRGLANAKFALKQGEQVIAEGVTNDAGELEFADVVYGDYQLVETEAPVGFVLDAAPITVQVREHGVVVDAGRVDNRAIRGEVTLTKVDVETNQPLADVAFELVAADGTVVDTQSTDKQGKLTFAQVRYGAYTVREKQPLEGYVAHAETYPVTIETDKQHIDLAVITNRQIVSDIQIHKVDATNDEPLAGVVFGLYPAPEALWDQAVAGEAVKLTEYPAGFELTGEPTHQATTNRDGAATFTNVKYGKWIVVELQPRVGFNPSPEKHGRLLTVVNDGEQIDIAEPFANTRITGTITLVKTDLRGKPLAGAEFVLTSKYGSEIARATSNAQGEVKFSGVEFGEYRVAETKAPTGYQLSEKTLEAQVQSEGEVVDLGKFTNQPVPVVPELPKTGVNTALLFLTSLIFFLGIGLLAASRRKH